MAFRKHIERFSPACLMTRQNEIAPGVDFSQTLDLDAKGILTCNRYRVRSISEIVDVGPMFPKQY